MKQYSSVMVIGAVSLLLIILLSSQIFKTLSPGEKGIMFRKFTSGLDRQNVYNEGFHVLAPWNEMYVYDVREQKIEENMDILDKNGLSINVDVSVRFQPQAARLAVLHERFGKNYMNQLIIPEVRSAVRKIMGRYTAEEIFSTKRTEVETSITLEAQTNLGSENNNIDVTALLIRSIKLPPQIKEAIENKLKQEQEALAYKFRLEREISEAERKRIAAEGEAAANLIIDRSLTDKLLKMRAIEATQQLITSPNAKVIVMGNGKDQLPIMLSGN